MVCCDKVKELVAEACEKLPATRTRMEAVSQTKSGPAEPAQCPVCPKTRLGVNRNRSAR